MRRRAFTLPEILVTLTIVLFLSVWVWSAFIKPRPDGRKNAMCQSNLKQISLGYLMYAQDYDARYPAAGTTSSTGWANVLQPYLRSVQVFQCPLTTNSTTFTSDYFYNSHLARLTQDKINQPARTVSFGDGTDNAPLWTNRTAPFPDATTNPNSPAQRHLTPVSEGANYAFTDGHVKWLAPGKISTTSPNSNTFQPTFAIH